MRGFVLGLLLMTQTCYGPESQGMQYLNKICNIMGGQGYECLDSGPVCCQEIIGATLYFTFISTIVMGEMCYSRCCKRNTKSKVDEIPEPAHLRKQSSIEKLPYMNTEERLTYWSKSKQRLNNTPTTS